ncbi:MAG: hypothetical protein HY015_02530, partial [Bacteroidetes bacterium]|nr:hypothetical protein [Bacteroidota bacterium]
MIAIIAANFFVPLTTGFFKNKSDYLVICNLSIIGALAFVIAIATKFTITKKMDVSLKQETRFRRMFKDKYIVLLAWFLVTSMVTFIFNQYSFQTLLNRQYPVQRDLTNFIG